MVWEDTDILSTDNLSTDLLVLPTDTLITLRQPAYFVEVRPEWCRKAVSRQAIFCTKMGRRLFSTRGMFASLLLVYFVVVDLMARRGTRAGGQPQPVMTTTSTEDSSGDSSVTSMKKFRDWPSGAPGGAGTEVETVDECYHGQVVFPHGLYQTGSSVVGAGLIVLFAHSVNRAVFGMVLSSLDPWIMLFSFVRFYCGKATVYHHCFPQGTEPDRY